MCYNEIFAMLQTVERSIMVIKHCYNYETKSLTKSRFNVKLGSDQACKKQTFISLASLWHYKNLGAKLILLNLSHMFVSSSFFRLFVVVVVSDSKQQVSNDQ